AQAGGVGVDAGDLGDARGGQGGVAVPGDGQLLGDGESCLARGREDADGGDVVRAGDGRGDTAAAQQQRAGGLPDLLGEVTGFDPCPVLEPVAGHGLAEGLGALAGDGRPDTADMGDLTVAETDQVIDQQPLADLVV